MGKSKSLEDGIIELEGPYVTKAMIATLQTHYPALKVDDGEKIILNLNDLALVDRERISLDLTFFLQNPALPLENLCSTIENYDPKNRSQRQLLKFAKKLVDFEDISQPAGLFIYGEAGVGKSHIAVAVSKEFMKRGYQPNFVQFSLNTGHQRPQLTPQQVWVLDDLNSPYGSPRDVFIKVALNAHNTGGRLFVTSNMDYHALMDDMARVIGDEDAQRYFDRTKGMFKALHVVGESNRQRTAWYTK